MTAVGKPLLLVFLLACGACGPAVHNPAADSATVVIRYQHVRTCTGFLGREGQFFVYRILAVENGGPTPFTVRPSRFRFADGEAAGAAPLLTVPEFGDLEVEPHTRSPSTEIYLVQRGGTEPPPPGTQRLRYAALGVRMDHQDAPVEYVGVRGCDEFNT
jgi:hypothetical protein